MDAHLDSLLRELERFGHENDEVKTERGERMLNITRDTGEFLRFLVRATGSGRILEIGTSNGYSTLWLAEAATATGGTVDTLERSPSKLDLARATFARSGLADRIRQHAGDAGAFFPQQPDAAYEFIFLDSHRPDYLGWWPQLRRLLAPRGVLVVDNATSHPHEMADFTTAVAADPLFTTALVPVGKGEFVAYRAS
jgi:predicted O-methyltransferase YrrM